MITAMSLEQLMQVAIAFVFGGGVSAMAAKRMLKDVALTGAETRVVELLRQEVERLAKQVDRLTSQVEALTTENHELREEIVEYKGLIHGSASN